MAQSSPLAKDLVSSIQSFIQRHQMADLYKSYRWSLDAWESGFPYLLHLETTLSHAAKDNCLGLAHLRAVAEWGRLRNVKRVTCPEVLELGLYAPDGTVSVSVKNDPLRPLEILQAQTKGLGPTYVSKVLHFSLPAEYGAIDTRLVRVFGEGDPDATDQAWLKLYVRDYGYGWFIPAVQRYWPSEFATWILILKEIAGTLNAAGIACPHPSGFVERGLRREGEWLCADVETALWSYASQALGYD
jgi:hypothetical protein